MFWNKNSFLAKEGWKLIAVFLVAAVVSNYFLGPLPAALFLVAAIGLTLMFREPKRDIVALPLGLVCPCNGTVTSVKQRDSAPFFDEPVIELTIRVGLSQGYVIHSPSEGYIRELIIDECTVNGGDTSARCIRWWTETDEKDSVVVSLAPTGKFNHAYCQVQPGERVRQGDRLGFLRFGGEVKLFLPLGSKIDVAEGAKVTAGGDIIAHFYHESLPRRQLD